jgi:transcription elongation factor Elf1
VPEAFYTQVLCPVCSSDPQDAEVKPEPTWFEATCTICGSEYKVLIDQEKVKKFAMVG